jgi:glycosyltransferase involved in cell wall biosynthesis
MAAQIPVQPQVQPIRTVPEIAVVIPAYNEENHIAKVIVGALKYTPWVIVCDDGSNDMTREISEKLGAMVIRHDTNMGKGVALRDLFQEAKGRRADVVVSMDGDGQHDPRDIPLLIKPILEGTADIVNGSRFLKKNPIPDHRKFGNDVLTHLTNAVSHEKFTDSTSGLRAYSKASLDVLEVKEHAMGVDSQLLIDAAQKGLRVTEVPTGVTYGDDTSTYHPARHGSYVILSILRVAAERSPLLYLGVPGVIFALVGLVVSLNMIALYNASHYFSVPQAMIALGAFLVGLFLIMGAMLLFVINNLVLRLRTR